MKTRKFRTDTTVVESDIHHPTDAILLQDGVKVKTRLIRNIRKVTFHAVQGFEERTAEIKEKIQSIAKESIGSKVPILDFDFFRSNYLTSEKPYPANLNLFFNTCLYLYYPDSKKKSNHFLLIKN